MSIENGGSLVVRTLKAAGAKQAFGLHGAHIDAIFQAALDLDFPIIDTRHEVSAGHAAEGYARVSGQFGVALVTAGGGFTNVVTSLANAWLDRTPVVVITGSGPLRDDETNTLQAGIDQVAMAVPVTKWAHRVVSTDHIPRLLEQAIRIATAAPQGPVLLDMPWDILTGPAGVAAAERVQSFAEPVAASGIDQALDLLARAERPVIVAGGEITRGHGAEALARFCGETGIPAVADFEGLTSLSDLPEGTGCGLVQGLFGLGANAPDVVIMAGMRFGLTTAHGSGILIPHSAKIIQIDPDPREFGRLQPIEMGLNGGVAATVGAMANAAAVRGGDKVRLEGWRKHLSGHVSARFDQLVKDCSSAPSERLHPFVASRLVCEIAAPGNVVVADGALTYLWLSETIARSRPRSFLCHGYLGAMGVGFGTALGAQKAAGDEGRRAILITGDGAVGYALGEFDTALRNDLPLIVVVMNNYSWGATQHFQKLAVGPNRVTKTMLPNGRYHEVAEAMNCSGYLATDESSLRDALTQALAGNRPACINVQVDLDPIPPEERIIMGGMPFDKDFQ
ncbi:thiamine pyrophosphate-binding protein [Agrobacterium vitis]|uniref:Thiamine pyrophosphate-binding protein n=1 Tax=Agrobacterium vitis TaxID=373 RepID=A0AAE4WAE9_AGRVI|nr:thiamine pyrophosphate-binding protein [Agrobacterium vitis]MCF1501754.1 thiamine pyrophosphate-binding protein [Allorhizobium sp. Av2]MCM2438739.1 thiamine pyrophosphate-binding protein [Agrobacterium vitis]MUZ56982.1 thiamine pyrophosphate-binding protein [Agrobacterium vitis]MVA69160.1 thiamine pyrophosphate-binding protein [Agrobacterium vitis]MVA85882.1 thiamine pyrophosphate-binding protein [Agrobacterium vitis]